MNEYIEGPTDQVAAMAAAQGILSIPDLDESKPQYDKICFKEQDDVRKDNSKWKWSQRDVMVDKIGEFCGQNFPKDEATADYDSGYENHDSFRLHIKYTGKSAPSKDWCTQLLQELVDGCDAHPRLNQFK